MSTAVSQPAVKSSTTQQDPSTTPAAGSGAASSGADPKSSAGSPKSGRTKTSKGGATRTGSSADSAGARTAKSAGKVAVEPPPETDAAGSSATPRTVAATQSGKNGAGGQTGGGQAPSLSTAGATATPSSSSQTARGASPVAGSRGSDSGSTEAPRSHTPSPVSTRTEPKLPMASKSTQASTPPSQPKSAPEKAAATSDGLTDKQRTERKKALDSALADITKSYGTGAIMRLGQDSPVKAIGCVRTGSLALDLALGGKGLPKGRIVEIYGPESSGKTTLTLHVIASAQKTGGICAFVDAEHALDPSYARKLGVKLDDLLISQPDTGEQALEIVEALVRSNAVDVVVIDSVAALVPRAEIEGEMGDAFVGLQARLMSQALRKLTAAIAKSDCLVIFINQIREKVGVMFGSPETTSGGRALKFYSSVRIDIRRIGQIKDGDVVVGNRTKVTVVKNKIAPPFRKVEFDILYARGISYEGDLIELGMQTGSILKSGTWFSYKHPTEGEIRLGQGREKARQFLIDNVDLAAELDQTIRDEMAPPPPVEPPPVEPPPVEPPTESEA